MLSCVSNINNFAFKCARFFKRGALDKINIIARCCGNGALRQGCKGGDAAFKPVCEKRCKRFVFKGEKPLSGSGKKSAVGVKKQFVYLFTGKAGKKLFLS